jgi:hypothetical protein
MECDERIGELITAKGTHIRGAVRIFGAEVIDSTSPKAQLGWISSSRQRSAIAA